MPKPNFAEGSRLSGFWLSQPRTRQDGGAERHDILKRAAHLRPRDPGVRGMVLFGTPPRVQPHGRAPTSDSPRTTRNAPATINLRLAAVRRIAYEAADAGLLRPEVVASIRRVRVCGGSVFVRNWLTPEQG
jgi:hypothetical protein